MKIDLHTHTTASDGTFTPEELVKTAWNNDVMVLAITDHDTMKGAAKAQETADKYGVTLIKGIEISSDYNGEDVHMLGYYLDENCEGIKSYNKWMVEMRNKRNKAIIEKIEQAGYDISMEKVQADNPDSIPGRPHIARYLLKIKAVESITEAFEKFLGDDCPYFVEKPRLPFDEAAKLIIENGGIAVLAHPLQYGYSDEELEKLIQHAKQQGLSALEVYYTGYNQQDREKLIALAEKYNMSLTGGTDFHGLNKLDIRLGGLDIPYQCYTDLKEKRG